MAVKKAAIFFLLLFLGSCSSSKDMSKIKTLYELYKNPDYQKVDRKITWNDVKDINYPLIEVRTNGVLYRALMLPLSTRYGFRNFSSGNGQSLTFEGALITKTNGINLGLLSLETNINNPLTRQKSIEEWNMEGTRKYTFMKPLYSSETITFSCNIQFENIEEKEILERTLKLYKFSEYCENKDLNFKNFYWSNNKGFIWKSVQWIGRPNIKAEVTILKKE